MKIILADDHALFREGMRHLLSRLDDEVVMLEADCHEATLKLLADHPDADIALVDLHMHGPIDNLAGLVKILEQTKTIPVVVLSGSENLDEIQQVIQAGAMGFIPKHEHAETMLCALRLVLSGGVYLPSMLMASPTGLRPHQTRLTPKQAEVLQQLGMGYSNKEIGQHMSLSDSTIKCHIYAIFRELNVDNRLQAVTTAKQLGLIA